MYSKGNENAILPIRIIGEKRIIKARNESGHYLPPQTIESILNPTGVRWRDVSLYMWRWTEDDGSTLNPRMVYPLKNFDITYIRGIYDGKNVEGLMYYKEEKYFFNMLTRRYFLLETEHGASRNILTNIEPAPQYLQDKSLGMSIIELIDRI